MIIACFLCVLSRVLSSVTDSEKINRSELMRVFFLVFG